MLTQLFILLPFALLVAYRTARQQVMDEIESGYAYEGFDR